MNSPLGVILAFSISDTGISSSLSSILGQDMSTGTTTRGRRNRRLTTLVEFSPAEMDVLDHDCLITRVVIKINNDPLGIRLGPDVPPGFG